MKQDLLRGGGIVGQRRVGAELSLQTSHVSSMCLHVHLLVGGGRGGEGGEERRERKVNVLLCPRFTVT